MQYFSIICFKELCTCFPRMFKMNVRENVTLVIVSISMKRLIQNNEVNIIILA